MKTNKFKYLLGAITTLCMVFILMPTTASANGPEVYDGDIYVRNGKYTIINEDNDSSSEEQVYYVVDEKNPIRGTGEPINRNIYVRDETELYFDDLDLGTGGIYAENPHYVRYPLMIGCGTLSAKEMKFNYSASFNYGVNIAIEEDVTGGILYNYADKLDVGGDIVAPIAWFYKGNDQSKVKIGGSIKCHRFYTENSIHIGENLNVSYYETNYFDYGQDPEWTKGDNFAEIHGVKGENSPMIYVGGEITVEDNIEIYNSTAFVNSINTKNGHIKIDDDSILFNAINKNPDVIPSNFLEPPLNLYRTTLGGLIPSREANIVISYDDHDNYTKEFTAKANEEGQVFVWLVGNKNLSGTATYDGDEPITLTAEASASSGVVENLEFPYEPDNDTPTSESNESSSTEGDSNVSTSDTETKKDDSDNAPKTTDSVKTIKADIPKTSDNDLMILWFVLSVTTLFALAGSIIKKRKINVQES